MSKDKLLLKLAQAVLDTADTVDGLCWHCDKPCYPVFDEYTKKHKKSCIVLQAKEVIKNG